VVSNSPLFSGGQQSNLPNDDDLRLTYSYPAPQWVPQPHRSDGDSSTPYSNHPTALPPINVLGNHPPPPQIGLLGATSSHEDKKKRKGGPGAVMTGRGHKRRLTKERQREFDDFQQQQPQTAQNGSTYGSRFGPGSPMHLTPSDSGGGALQDSDSHERKHKLSSAPSRQGLVKSQAQQVVYQTTFYRPGENGGVNGKGKSNLAPVDTATTSISESGTPSAPPSLSPAERYNCRILPQPFTTHSSYTAVLRRTRGIPGTPSR
jgi:hypothetical protein